MSAGDAENPSNFTSTFFNTVNFLPEDLTFEHGGTKRASGPGRHLTSLCPCVKRTQMVVTVRFTIRVFLTFSDCKESKAIKPSHEKMWSLKTRTVARKSWIEGVNLRQGTWHSEILIKYLLIYSVSYLNLEGLSSPMPTVATGMVKISLILSLLKYVERKKLQSSNQVRPNIPQ